MLAATDGHAKNFSLFIGPDGQSLTPLYDVMSAAPAVQKKQVQPKSFKMAMAVGKSRYYRMDRIDHRHWLETAQLCRFAKSEMQSIIDEVRDRRTTALSTVDSQIPRQFPDHIWDAIRARVAMISK